MDGTKVNNKEVRTIMISLSSSQKITQNKAEFFD